MSQKDKTRKREYSQADIRHTFNLKTHVENRETQNEPTNIMGSLIFYRLG